MFTVVFQQIGLVIKLFISKATDFWSFWIICWKTNVNLNHFYLLICGKFCWVALVRVVAL